MKHFFLVLLMAVFAWNCGSNKAGKIEPGSICTIDDGGGRFGVVKVLVMEDGIVHLKIYKNKFNERPARVNIGNLGIGSVTDKDGFGVGHVPMDKQAFDEMKPVAVGFQQVTEKDLEGYEIWKNQ
jgi:hypothetical protein